MFVNHRLFTLRDKSVGGEPLLPIVYFLPLKVESTAKTAPTISCLGKPRGSDLSAKGWSGKGLEPKGEAFLRPPGCANRGRTTWFPAPRSPSSLTCGPPLPPRPRMPTLGYPGAHEMGVPSRHGDP